MKTKAAKLLSLLLVASVLFIAGMQLLFVSSAQTSTQMSFDRDIRPIFANHCLKCHSETKQSGGLRLDAKAFAVRGSVIVPGNAAASRLLQRVSAANEDERMPPAGERLSAQQIALLKTWIDAGAIWPDGDGATEGKRDRETREQASKGNERLQHWAWQAIQKPIVPIIQNPKSKIQNPIDAFILARLAQAGLTMSPEADRRTLIRRLYFDLTGLPPSPERVQQFVNDRDPRAYEKLVDELLASPRYGERWAR
ncbi:MAG TPA: DUF1549 domain-containing protein, partial [Blastocatellia bacterium]|nr:DUF1549 domain-containing protein [Blastocatellia bacterium]